MKPVVVSTEPPLRQAVAAARRAGKSVGLVPTMGALHAGHVSLVTRARTECEVVAVSIFVNPLQFGDPDDIARYPRTLDEDLAVCAQAGVASAVAGTARQIGSVLGVAVLGSVVTSRLHRQLSARLAGAQLPEALRLKVSTAAIGRTLHLAGEQALTLVEAQRVHAEPGPFGHLPDGQALCWLGHGTHDTT